MITTCPRCKREVNPWPCERGNRCSPKSWVRCIRNDQDILKLIAANLARP